MTPLMALALPAALALACVLIAPRAKSRIAFWILVVIGGVTLAGLILRGLTLMLIGPDTDGAAGLTAMVAQLGTIMVIPGLAFGPFLLPIAALIEYWTRRNAPRG